MTHVKTIYFVTSNKGKILALQNRLPDGFEVEQLTLEVPEIQHSDVAEIVKEKARFAFEVVQKPLVMHDAAFCIPAFSGFPGPYAKYINETIGVRGLLKLMEGIEDRRAYFKLALAHVGETGEVHVFTYDVSRSNGTLAEHVAESNSEKPWSGIWNIYCPAWGNGKTLSQLSDEDIDAHEKEEDSFSEFYYFAEWLKANEAMTIRA